MASQLEALCHELLGLADEMKRHASQLPGEARKIRAVASQLAAVTNGSSRPPTRAISRMEAAAKSCENSARALVDGDRAARLFVERTIGGGGSRSAPAPGESASPATPGSPGSGTVGPVGEADIARIKARVAKGLGSARDFIDLGEMVDQAASSTLQGARAEQESVSSSLAAQLGEAAERKDTAWRAYLEAVREKNQAPPGSALAQLLAEKTKAAYTATFEASLAFTEAATSLAQVLPIRDAVLGVLESVRNFGDGTGPPKDMLPSDWLHALDASGLKSHVLERRGSAIVCRDLATGQESELGSAAVKWLTDNGVGPERAFHLPEDSGIPKGVYLPADAVGGATHGHELGHAVEDIVPGVHAVLQEFLEMRTVGDTPMKLSDLFPGWGYRDEEQTRPDDFIHPYMGKRYPDATELLSMGIEFLFDPLLTKNAQGVQKGGMLFKDRDYFHLILGILAGGGAAT